MPTENAHDKLFKSALADPKDAAMELLAVLPPTLASQIDFSTLEPMPGTFVDERMRSSHADLLYRVQCAGKETLLYVLLEHKSDADRWTLLQLLRYMVRIWEHCLAQKPPLSVLPQIIPIIVHHSETGWTAPAHFQGLFEELPAWADLLRLLAATPSCRRALLQLFRYLSMVASNISRSEFVEQVQRTIPERNDIVSTLAEQWMEEGKLQGRLEGRKNTVRRQIELKFGPLTRDALARLESADEAALERYTEQVLTATRVEEVLGE